MDGNAEERYRRGASCAQATLGVLAERLGISEEEAARLAAPFGSGMAGLGGPCGVVTAGLMAIGLRFGSGDPQEAKGSVFRKSKEFAARFKEKHGTLVCAELLAAPGELKGRERCASFVRDAEEILKDILKS